MISSYAGAFLFKEASSKTIYTVKVVRHSNTFNHILKRLSSNHPHLPNKDSIKT